MEKDILYYRSKKKKRISIFISDKIYFKTKNVAGGQKRHCMMIKESIQLEDITITNIKKIVNIYVLNIGAPKYIKQIITDKNVEMDSNTIIGNFSLHLASMDR